MYENGFEDGVVSEKEINDWLIQEVREWEGGRNLEAIGRDFYSSRLSWREERVIERQEYLVALDRF
jgi:hypothetical protein